MKVFSYILRTNFVWLFNKEIQLPLVSRSHDKIANLNNQVNQLRETSDLCTTSECIQSGTQNYL